LLQRKPDSHKGDYGHILIVAGSKRYSGAALLCAEAALRSGAGIVTLGLPESLCNPVIKIKPKEIMLLPLAQAKDGEISAAAYNKIVDFLKKADVFVLGPGLGLNISTQKLVRKLVKTVKKPFVIDADALTALAGVKGVRFGAETVATPHPGEMARLIGIPAAVIQKKRKEVAKNFAAHYNSTVVLKGGRTVVASTRGSLYVNTTGNPGMATAGSGDVLAGVIAAFLGQGLDGFNAAKYGVYIHGMAGDLAAKQKTQLSLIASDIIDFLPKAIKKST
jgi:NAD(P)H-hydrate epimerase